MKNKLVLSAVSAMLMFSVACKKNSNDSSSGYKSQVNYQLKTTNTQNGVAQKGTSSGMIHWTSAVAYPTAIKFEAKQNNTEIEYKSTNDAQIDLMSSVSVTFGNFVIPAGTYNEVEITLQFDKKASTPAIQLNGQFTNSLVSIPVVLEIDELHDIKTEQHDVVITDNTSFTAVTTFDLAVLTADITETMLLNASLTNGVIVISSNSNHSIYNVVVDDFRKKKHKCDFDKHK